MMPAAIITAKRPAQPGACVRGRRSQRSFVRPTFWLSCTSSWSLAPGKQTGCHRMRMRHWLPAMADMALMGRR